jgi:RNA polymerase sigma factor (sigma-70 family)
VICSQQYALPSLRRPRVSKHISPKLAEERDLIRKAQAGDHEALGILCEKYRSRITKAAFRILRDRGAAEDAVQTAFLRVVEHIKEFANDALFSTWLTRITINEALMQKRSPWERRVDIEADVPETSKGSFVYRCASRSSQDRILDNMPEMIDLKRCIGTFTPEEQGLFKDFLEEKSRSVREVERSTLIIRVLRAMRKLKPKDRAIIVLRYFKGKTIKETARMEKTTVPMVKLRTLRAHHALRQFVTVHAH